MENLSAIKCMRHFQYTYDMSRESNFSLFPGIINTAFKFGFEVDRLLAHFLVYILFYFFYFFLFQGRRKMFMYKRRRD